MNPLTWTDQLPDNWEAKPLRSVADYVVSNVDKVPDDDEIPVRLCNYTDVYNNEFITSSLDLMHATASEAEIAKFGLAADDVIITKDSESWDDIGEPALVRETAGDLVCGYHLALLRPIKQTMDGGFLLRCLQTKLVRVQLELAANGVTRFGIPKSEIGTMWLPVPPLPQQRIIAEYLNRETARLDALAAAKERTLELLAEKRRTLITHAVTRGLDPSAPLHDSGIPWLGEIPAHWRIERLKFYLHGMEQGWSPICDNVPAAPEEWGVLKAGCVNDWEFDPNQNKRLPDNTAPRLQYEIFRGDVVISRANTTSLLGSTALVGEVRPRLLLCDKLYRLHLNDETLNRRYLVSFLRTPVGRYAFERDATGASNSMQNIGQDSVRNLWLPIPPVNEQSAIVDHIGTASVKLEAMHATTVGIVKLLKERRAAIIAAAVMGQIDIRAAS